MDSSGNEITYTLSEDAVNGYSSEITGDAENGFIVTNTETVTVYVEKIFSQGIEESVTIRLVANGESTDNTIALSADVEWKGSFENLPKYDSEGNTITYSVEETAVYDANGNNIMAFYHNSIINNSDSGYEFTITNYYGASG
jgi:hypothetical protein